MDTKESEFVDKVAIAAMQAMGTGKDLRNMGAPDKAAVAKASYEIAKAMLEARKEFQSQHKSKPHL